MNRLDEIQRQIELAAIVSEAPGKWSENDLAEKLHTSVSTIRRDVKSLREMGIDIRSRKLTYRVELPVDTLNQLIVTYLAFENSESIKNLPLIMEKFGSRTLGFFIKTAKAIRDKKVVEIEYRSAQSDRLGWRTITPIAFYNAGKSHYLMAIHQETPKMFTLERIRDFRFPNQKSSVREIPALADLFRNSWGSFTGGKLTRVRLLFKDNLEGYMSDKFWLEGQEAQQTDEGFAMGLHIKISNELIAWIMGWGASVRVIEPDDLRDAVLRKARAIVALYDS